MKKIRISASTSVHRVGSSYQVRTTVSNGHITKTTTKTIRPR